MNIIHTKGKSALVITWLATLACMVAGGGPAVAAEAGPWTFAFSLSDASLGDALPTALYVDADKKRYYLVDSAGGRLASFGKDGSFLKTFQPTDGLDRPFDMVRLSDSQLLVVEKGTNSLTVIDFARQETKRIEVQGQGRRLMVDRLEMTPDGRLYLLDRASGELCRLAADFAVAQRFALPEGSGGIVDFKVVGDRIWALDQLEKQIYVYLDNGRLSKRIDLASLVSFPVSVAVDGGGLLYVLDRHQGTVVVLDRKANLKYRFLSKGHGRHNLYFPMEIRFDPWGRLCIVDEGNGRLQVYSR